MVGRKHRHACRLQVSLSCAVLCQIVFFQYLFRSSLHRLAGLPCRLFLSYGLHMEPREVHRSSLWRFSQDYFIFLTLLILSMTFVLSLTQILVFLSLYVMLIILVCAAARLFCACLFSDQVSATCDIAGSTQELYTCLYYSIITTTQHMWRKRWKNQIVDVPNK